MSTEPRRRKILKGKKACTLSAALKGNPSLFDGRKLSLVGLDIHFIDMLPSKISETMKTIYLSNNYIATLVNLDQFQRIETASIMNNNIRYLDEIQILSRLKGLKVLSLQGNVVTKMPFYREHVVTMCQALTLLDDEKVTPEYRQHCKDRFHDISTFYSNLRLNELRNSTLRHVDQLMECHCQLRAKFGREDCFSHTLKTHVKDTQGLVTGAGTILQVALQGGVFCWLQRMDSKYFNRLVQDTLYKLLVVHIQEHPDLGHLQGTQLSSLWFYLVDVYLKDQYSLFLLITAHCALLARNSSGPRRGRGGGVGEEEDRHRQDEQEEEEARDLARTEHCVGRLQFLSSPCAMHCMQPHTSDRWRPSMVEQLQLQRLQYHQYQRGQSAEDELPAPPPPAPVARAQTVVASAGRKFVPPLVQRLNRAATSHVNEFPSSSGSGNNQTHLTDFSTTPVLTRHVNFATSIASKEARDPYVELLQRSHQQQEVSQLLSEGVVAQGRSQLLSGITAGGAEQRLRDSSYSEHISERYEQLLHRQQHRGPPPQQQPQQQEKGVLPSQLHQTSRMVSVGSSSSSSSLHHSHSSSLSAGDTQPGKISPRERLSVERLSDLLPRQQDEPDAVPLVHYAARRPHHCVGGDAATDAVFSERDRGSAGAAQTPTILLTEEAADRVYYQHRHPKKSPAVTTELPTDRCNSAEDEDQSGADDELRQLEQHAESPQFTREVNAFLERALRRTSDADISEGEAAQERQQGQEELEDLTVCQEVQSRWLLLAEGINSYITSSAHAEELRSSLAQRGDRLDVSSSQVKADFFAEGGGGSMRALRSHIDKTLFDHLRRTERNVAIVHSLYRSLLTSVSAFQEQAQAVSDSALLHLATRGEAVRAVQRDSRYGEICLQVHEKSMGHIEDVRGRIAEQRARERSALQEEEALRRLLDEQADLHSKLTTELDRAASDLASARHEEQADVAVLAAKESRRRDHLTATFYPTSRSCAALKRYMFRLLRTRTTRQRKIKKFHQSVVQRWGKMLKRAIFSSWREVVRTACRGQQLQHWREKNCKSRIIETWAARCHRRRRVVPAITGKVTRNLLRRAFDGFYAAAQRRRSASETDERHALYVALFQSIRVFRAWRDLTRASAAAAQQCLSRARHCSLQRIFDAWASVAKNEHIARSSLEHAVELLVGKRSKEFSLSLWRRLLHYRVHLGMLRRKRRAFAVLQQKVGSRLRQKRLQAMAAVVAGSSRGLMRSRMVGAWKRWHLRTARARYFRCASASIAQRQQSVAEFRAWHAWRFLFQHKRSLQRKESVVSTSAYIWALHRHFFHWKAAAALRRAKVPHLREQWLHLFDQPPQRHPIARLSNHTLVATEQDSFRAPLIDECPSVITNTGKLRRSLSNLEFQLLFWDDDDEDVVRKAEEGEEYEEEEEEEEKVDRCARVGDVSAASWSVLVRRYMVRWWDRVKQRESLKRRFGGVVSLVAVNTRRRALSAMAAGHSRSLLRQRNECRQFLFEHAEAGLSLSPRHSQAEIEMPRRFEIESGAGDSLCQQEDLQQLADGLSLQLAAADQEHEQQRATLRDLSQSLSALQAEKTSLEDRVREARDYIAAVTIRRDQRLARTELASAQASQLPSLLARLVEDATIGSMCSGERSAVSENSLSMVSEPRIGDDERLLLMQDVEALYREAVAGQEALLKKKQHLANQREAAHALLQQRRQVAQELDAHIEGLAAERARAEGALRACQTSLEEAFTRVALQTKDHEAHLTTLEGEEAHMKERLALLAQQERLLSEQVDGLEAQRSRLGLHSSSSSGRHRFSAEQEQSAPGGGRAGPRSSSSGSSSPLTLARREALAAAHLASLRGFSANNHNRISTSTRSAPPVSSPISFAGGHSDTVMLFEGKENNHTELPPVAVSANSAASKAAPPRKQDPAASAATDSKEAQHRSTRATAGVKAAKAASRKATRAALAEGAAPCDKDRQSDIDREIEALSLRIKQRLTTV